MLQNIKKRLTVMLLIMPEKILPPPHPSPQKGPKNMKQNELLNNKIT